MAFRSLLNTYKIRNSRVLSALYTSHYNYTFTNKNTDKRLNSNKYEVGKFKSFVVQKYYDFVKNYINILKKKFPSAMNVYSMFTNGTRDFFYDLKLYMGLVKTMSTSNKTFDDFKLHEIELYYQMPNDMKKVAPVLLISALPFTGYIMFPLLYYFPRQLLCSHFWNIQQKSEFGIVLLKKRLLHNKPIFRHLQLQLPRLKENMLHKKWSNVLGQLGSGSQPTANEILECMDLFKNGPYHLMYLSGNHVRHLLKMHELSNGIFRRRKLINKAIILRAMDRAIARDGGPEKLSVETLKRACSIRGLNPTNMKHLDMIIWITKWIIISNKVDDETVSLLLHCPVLLAYNEPTNWQLIYSHKTNQLT